MLQKLNLRNYCTSRGAVFLNIPLSYQVFGCALGEAPVVFVTHPLTGNSSVSGKHGWWNKLVGKGKTIDLDHFTVISFDIPGNGYNGFIIKDYKSVSVKDVSQWFLYGLEQLGIDQVFAGIGGSLGGCVLWQMAIDKPELFENLIPIAADWKATDWVLAQCRIQTRILENSTNPVHDARMHAMTFYRSPLSLKKKFGREKDETDCFRVESWLEYHGEALKKRCHLLSYKLLNHLLTTVAIDDFFEKASRISGRIFLVGIPSDRFFLNDEILETYRILKKNKKEVFFSEITSVHGHDAFLIEYERLHELLEDVFQVHSNLKKIENYECTAVG